MKLSKNGKRILVSVENITPYGIWLFVNGKEYFLDYSAFPFFKEQAVAAIHNVELLHGFHLYWPDLDIDLEIDNLENPKHYPLTSKKAKGTTINKAALSTIRTPRTRNA